VAGDPKQHHYVPQVYLKAFAESDGFVWIHDLWDPDKNFRAKPEKILKQNGLYTQPVHAEARFDAVFEKNFSELEDKWPAIRIKLQNRDDLSLEEKDHLIQFICLMRVRVPNTLKAVSKLLIDLATDALQRTNTPVPPDVLSAFLEVDPNLAAQSGDQIVAADLLAAGMTQISVDPHRSLTALPLLVRSMLPVVGRRGLLSYVHNKTSLEFVTSDNPVVYAHHSIDALPYMVGLGDFDFFFALSPILAISFSTLAKGRPVHRNEFSEKVVRRLNDRTIKFADRYVVARSKVEAEALSPYRDVCPVPDLAASEVLGTGDVVNIGYRWGPPIRSLPKWQYEFAR
jgi:hypothetical protein